ncbi:MAG TPA: 30S ribosomal protein S2 [Candidatus Marinimicrobia bacterium]|jgi:small subunit ribosomal protein S2|nr:30S ribosomal protein S2 [Candidatus Neomarinimicrobiota bacterium]HIA85637.1 30S ribosomal protein S2 [Candidatus Neomarinimicrobiota bacterium]HIB58396.1 30S ribosomal protein S2 [Candidatus Neomarinimicrobiota bacterium]HIC51032.1 30S ribosomal protein S2 [Candidatus Neomarinimicrobiota bacterium]
MDLTFDDLLSTGAHFGHLTRKWDPNFQQYILMVKNGIHIINLEETLKELRKAVEFIQSVTSEGGDILFVGTKKNAKNIVQEEADKCSMYYVVERWLGGTLTNYSTIRKSIKRLMLLEKESSPLYDNATKKEILSLEREMIRLQDLHRGIKDMKGLPDAIFVVDTYQESIAVDEAKLLNIPVVAIVDTNSNPNLIDYPIPANDDSIRAVKLIVSEISKAICESKSIAYPEGKVSLEEAVPEEEDLSNETEMGDESEIAGSDGKQIEELVVDSSKED